jgi:2OG-Fe(II) oxygenase superfamily
MLVTIESIRDLGYEVDEIAPRVFQIHQFATPEQTKILFDEAAGYSDDDWRGYYISEMKRNCLQKFGRDDLENLIAEGLLEVTHSWEDKNIQIASKEVADDLGYRSKFIFNESGELGVTGFTIFQRLYEGTQLISHFDQYSDKLVEYASVLYLNDDYTEGELFFPRLGLDKVRPKPGDLVVFPGTAEYEHGVHPVGPGPVRYVIPTFIKRKHPDGPMAGWADFG